MIVKILLFLNSLTMPVPTAWGWFHILCLTLSAFAVGCFIVARRKNIPIAPNRVFAWYGFSTLLFELTKQLMWSVQKTDGVVVWAYSWYSAPFQFCTMPLYICLALCFLKRETLRAHLYSFLAFYSVISMTLVMLFPGDVFTRSVVINIHTMLLHGGGFIVAMFVIVNRLTDFTAKSVLRGAAVFLCLTGIALALNIIVERSGINHGAEFNMFYISPYYPCRLPVFCRIQELVPYPLFLLIYISSMCLGSLLVLGMIRGVAMLREYESSGSLRNPSFPAAAGKISEASEMQKIDCPALSHEEIRAGVHSAAQSLFPERNFSADSKDLPFSEMGLDEVDVALFLLRLEEVYQIRFSFLLPLSSLGDVCTQIEAYTGSLHKSR